jgi:malto-oligosyltrehalose trehalohydrolase
MTNEAGGWFGLTVPEAKAGDLYRFVLDDGRAVADPASRFQPVDVFGPSEIIDVGGFDWADADWSGRPWETCVIYELHIGSFTPQGTFLAAIEKLDHLVALGVTAIEIMPVADFPGSRNWGYDGVFLYAPDNSYGRPEDLRRLVEAAHGKGLMVLLDVVYNHFGPQGNLMGQYAPRLFTDKHKTPWGNAINYGHEGSRAVRDFIISNACYWISAFNLDGLRLDAVHAIIDESPKHVLKELAERVRAVASGRQVHLILENDLNQAHLLARHADGTPRWYNAQWNDDFHHCLHAAATAETFSYYGAYQAPRLTARALAEGFAYQGEVTPFTNRPRGEISKYLPPTAFVSFIQNHDQIGNRPFGERITHISTTEAARAITAIYLLAPEIPMLFMGEEWCATQPFQYFCGFEGTLAESIRKGRREEFSGYPAFSDPAERDRIPDPTAPATFEASKLDWSALEQDPHKAWLAWYRAMLAVRREKIVPYLSGAPGGVAKHDICADGCIHVGWRLGQGRRLYLTANLRNESGHQSSMPAGDLIWLEGQCDERGTMAPWTVIWTLEETG